MSTTDRSLEQRLADLLAAEAPSRGPDRLADTVLAVTARRRPRPRWLSLVREPPLALDARPAFGSPSARAAAILVVTLLAVLLAVATVVVGASLLTPGPTSLIPPDRGVFTPAGTTLEERSEGVSATTLPDGPVLVIGGYGTGELSAELWDPQSGTFILAGSLDEGSPDDGGAFGSNRATLLPGGRVLVVGDLAAVWDPETQAFSPAWPVSADHALGPATLLTDGRVLVIRDALESEGETLVEIWDPATSVLTSSGRLITHGDARPLTATLLSDGRVLIINDGAAQIWDPATSSSAPTGSLGSWESLEVNGPSSATLLPDGRVLVITGEHSAQVWDAGTGLFAPTGSRLEARSSPTTTLLPDGRVLLAGGQAPCIHQEGDPHGACSVIALDTAEIWDPATGAFVATGSLTMPRLSHAATLLLDGRVLLVGGSGTRGAAELFELR